MLGRLFQEWRPDAEQVEDLLASAAAVQREMADGSPLVARAVDDWFAAGMPDSPFAGPLDEARQGVNQVEE